MRGDVKYRRDLTRRLEATIETARLQERRAFLEQESEEVGALELLRA